jgi:hypothetical protein
MTATAACAHLRRCGWVTTPGHIQVQIGYAPYSYCCEEGSGATSCETDTPKPYYPAGYPVNCNCNRLDGSSSNTWSVSYPSTPVDV